MLPTIERRAFISDVDVTNLRLLHFLPGNCSICRVPSQFPPFPFYSTLLPLTRSALVSNVIRAPLRQQEEQLLGSADWGTVCVDSSSEITIFSNRIFRFVKISHLTFFGYLENAGILLLVFFYDTALYEIYQIHVYHVYLFWIISKSIKYISVLYRCIFWFVLKLRMVRVSIQR